MLDHLVAHHAVEAVVGVGEVGHGAHLQVHIAIGLELLNALVHHVRAEIDAADVANMGEDHPDVVASAAAGVANTLLSKGHTSLGSAERTEDDLNATLHVSKSMETLLRTAMVVLT